MNATYTPQATMHTRVACSPSVRLGAGALNCEKKKKRRRRCQLHRQTRLCLPGLLAASTWQGDPHPRMPMC
jgi:hypothetical protein